MGKRDMVRLSLSLRRKTGAKTVEIKRLANVWLLEKWPVESLDACKYDEPPFADINGVAGKLYDVQNNIIRGIGGIYIVVGSNGSGKSTFLKKLNNELRRAGMYSVYIDASGRSFDELLTHLCNVLSCESEDLEGFKKALQSLALKEEVVTLLIDNIDKITDENKIEKTISIMSVVLELREKGIRNIVLVLSMRRELLAGLAIDPIAKGILRAHVNIIDLDDHLVNSLTDVTRLYFAHLSAARPKKLTPKARKILQKNPLHPIESEEVVKLIYETLGSRTPREYLQVLDELLRIAIQSRSRRVTLSHANIVVRKIAESGRGAPLPYVQELAMRKYVEGILAGGLVVLGTLVASLSLLRLLPPGLRPLYTILGLMLIAIGAVVHARSLRLVR